MRHGSTTKKPIDSRDGELEGRQLTLFDVDVLSQSTSAREAPSSEERSTVRRTVVQPRQEGLAVTQPESTATDSLLSPEDVARRCGLSRKAVYRAVARGELRAARILSRLRIDPCDVETWIRANTVDAKGPMPVPARSRSPATAGLRRLLPEP